MLRFIDESDPATPEAAGQTAFDTSAMEADMGDQAGLNPLPLARMYRQAGRPMSPQSRNQDTSLYGKNTSVKVDPALHQLTIQRNQRNQDAIENWNPLNAESKQRLNNTNPNPRSRPAAPNNDTAARFFTDLGRQADHRRLRAFQESNKHDPGWSSSGGKFREFLGQERKARDTTDPSLFLTSQEKAAVRSMTFDFLDAKAKAKGRSKLGEYDLPAGLDHRFPKLGNDLLYEWNARRQKELQNRTLDVLQISKDTIRAI
jgi:hypothetical protein